VTGDPGTGDGAQDTTRHRVHGLRTEAELLLDALSARLSAARTAAPEPAEVAACAECGRPETTASCTTGCPFCTVLGVIRGERPELTRAVLDASTTVIGAVRSLLAHLDAAAPTHGAPTPTHGAPTPTDGAPTPGDDGPSPATVPGTAAEQAEWDAAGPDEPHRAPQAPGDRPAPPPDATVGSTPPDRPPSSRMQRIDIT
jgi:hypothetical protein